MTRSPERAAALRARGVDAVVADALDPDGRCRAIVAARPEVVVNQLTALPARIDPRHYERRPRRRRRSCARHRARSPPGPPREAGARRRGRPSASSFMLDPWGRVLDETAPLSATRPGRGPMAARRDARAGGDATPGIEGVVLRYGLLLRRRAVSAPAGRSSRTSGAGACRSWGAGTGLLSFIAVDDAAAATVLAARPRGARRLQRHRRRARSPSATGCACSPTRSARRPRGASRSGSRGCSPARGDAPR